MIRLGKNLHPPMIPRLLACLLLLTVSPATWAGVMCMAKDHTAIKPADAACCVSTTRDGIPQLEAGGCGPCVDVKIGATATLKHENTRDTASPRSLSPDAALSAASISISFSPHFARADGPTPPNLRVLPSLLSPLRC